MAQIFEVEGNLSELRAGTTICESGEPPRYMAAYRVEIYGSEELRLAFFGGDTPPAGTEDPDACERFSYWMQSPGANGNVGGPVATEAPPGPVDGASIPMPSVAPGPADAPAPQDAPEIASAEPPVVPAPVVEPAAPPPNPGRWNLSRSTNPLDDSETVVLRLMADRGRSEYGDPITFIARCQSNTTEVYIIWNDFLGDDSSDVYDEFKYVTVRIGEAPASEERWSLSTDKEATFAPDWAGGLLKRMLEADQMVVQTTPYNESSVTAIFDIRGLDAVLPELAKTCHWSGY